VRLGRIAFLGTGEFGVPLLERLAGLADEVLVVSQPDRPAGRGLASRPSPVSTAAQQHGLRVETPRRLRSPEGRALLKDFAPDGLLLVAYGQLVPEDLLGAFRLPPLNVHPSLLPRHRGAAPVAATILAGDLEAGLTLMVMSSKLDAGPVAEQWRVRLDGRERRPDLEARLAALAAAVIPPVLGRWAAGELRTVEQDEDQATTIRPFDRASGAIDWTRSAVEIDRLVRALQPWPGAWTLSDDGRRLHVRAAKPLPGGGAGAPGSVRNGEGVEVATGDGTLLLEQVQPEGRPVMPAADWRRGIGRRVLHLGLA
jgi:methionyl-tRNA formyltransferase